MTRITICLIKLYCLLWQCHYPNQTLRVNYCASEEGVRNTEALWVAWQGVVWAKMCLVNIYARASSLVHLACPEETKMVNNFRFWTCQNIGMSIEMINASIVSTITENRFAETENRIMCLEDFSGLPLPVCMATQSWHTKYRLSQPITMSASLVLGNARTQGDEAWCLTKG